MSSNVEFANADRVISSALEGCAQWCQVPFETVRKYHREGRLGELIEQRQFLRSPTGREALRAINEKRYGPGDSKPSPAKRIGELRAMRFVWRVEELEALRRPRDPFDCLDELRRKQIPSWWGLV